MQPPSFSLLLLAAALSTISNQGGSFAAFQHRLSPPTNLLEAEAVSLLRIWPRTSKDFEFYDCVAPESYVRRKRSAEPEPEAEASPAGFEDFNFNFLGPANNGFPNAYYNALNHHDLARRSAEPEPEAEAEPSDKSLSKLNFYYFPGQGWPDAIRSALFNYKQRRSAEPEPTPEAKSFAKSIKDLHFNSLFARSMSLMSMI